jgi:hypothetical protein
MKFLEVESGQLVETEFEPDPDYLWRMDTGKPTYLQIKTATRRGKWILKRGGRDDPAYWLEIKSVEPGYLVDILCHLAEKRWVNQGQLLEAMLPLFRAAREIHFAKREENHA